MSASITTDVSDYEARGASHNGSLDLAREEFGQVGQSLRPSLHFNHLRINPAYTGFNNGEGSLEDH